MIYNEGQERVIQAGVHHLLHSSNQVFEYTGGPGTGKTEVLMEILRRAKVPMNKVAPMAYIGQAAIVMRLRGMMNAKTIHSWLYDIKEEYVYDKNGVSGSYCPYEESRIMLSSIIKDTTKINSAEASELAYNYEFGKKESTIMVGISKEFVNTYIETGRKLPLGGREKSNISLAKKVKPAKANTYPKKVGVNADGTDKYETVNEGMIPEHNSIRVFGSCPSWVKQK